jgi:DNA-binding NtrC family response regulator
VTRRPDETLPGTLETVPQEQDAGTHVVGLVLVYAAPGEEGRAGRPMLRPISVVRDPVMIGRSPTADVSLDDHRLSREHVTVHFDGERWHVTDMKSRNGVFVDGVRIEDTRTFDNPCTLRIGSSVFVFTRNLKPLLGASVADQKGTVVGPRLGQVWSAIEVAARSGDTLSIIGASGVGKELAARVFHDAGPRLAGPLVAINCATIPTGLAERMLFGARRGAYSGADADVDGYVQSADGGTLFLDEIAELDPTIQAKLLRVIETREVLPLGANKPRRVSFGLVSATHHSLRDAVATQRLREDLFYRIGRPEVVMPLLRDRPEEIPWLLASAVHGVSSSLAMHVLFVEACLLRPWPGNVRELLAEARRSAHGALAAGSSTVEERFLDPHAGRPVRMIASSAESTPSATAVLANETEVETALREANGNVTAAARRLGLHRNQLRRWLARRALAASSPDLPE